jgi:hypothetical protein
MYLCQGAFHPLTPGGFQPSRFLATRMQEARAPQPVDMNGFNGQLVHLHWQVAEGDALWGVVVTPIAPSQLEIRWRGDQPSPIEAPSRP